MKGGKDKNRFELKTRRDFEQEILAKCEQNRPHPPPLKGSNACFDFHEEIRLNFKIEAGIA
ncbi:MAG: hypothetical protein AAB316_02390, partial [Bacteroidota bacterium]